MKTTDKLASDLQRDKAFKTLPERTLPTAENPVRVSFLISLPTLEPKLIVYSKLRVESTLFFVS